MLIVQILSALLVGYMAGYLHEYQKLRKKERECLNKKQMIENRDKLIEEQQNKINKIKIGIKTYEQIKEVYRTERKIVDRDDKVKELIEKDND